MIFDIEIPWLFRIRAQILCAERFSSIFELIKLDLRVPFISWTMLFHYGFSMNPICFRHWRVIELAKMHRQGCYRVLLFGKTYRDFYDGYPTKEQNESQFV